MENNQEPIKATNNLNARLDKMLVSIDKELARYDSEIGTKLNILKPDEEGRLTIGDLEEVLKVIKNHPEDERIKNIVKKLDKDSDGFVALQEIIHLAEEEYNRSEGTGIVKNPEGSSQQSSQKSP